jgi:rhodanese-related sulfurtransferase
MSGVPSISVRDAATELEARRESARGGAGAAAGGAAEPLLVDVRERDEFIGRRAVGAVLLPISEFVARHDELPKDRPLLIICESGSRSMSAAMFLLQRGWSDVRNVDGGTQAWAAAGLPVRQGPPEPGEGDLPG